MLGQLVGKNCLNVNGSYANSILSWNNYDLIKKVLEHIINEVVS